MWAGVTVGVSLLATPARFSAATITRPVALDVGRVVFAALNKAELLALVLLLIVLRAAGLTRRWWAVGAMLTLVVMAQGIWLIPELASRTDIIIAGGEPPPSPAHAIYASLEFVKIGLLVYCGFAALAERR